MNDSELQNAAGVALEPATSAALAVFVDLVLRWNPRINLVSRSTVADIWHRHVADSAQLFRLTPAAPRRYVDVGTGGGFPGIVLAILYRQTSPRTDTVLVEVDQRKGTFLREAIRVCGLASARVETQRAEQLAPLGADLITARALAPLGELISLAYRHAAPGAVALFPKGRSWQYEVDAASVDWAFQLEAPGSRTDAEARILRLTEFGPKDAVEGR